MADKQRPDESELIEQVTEDAQHDAYEVSVEQGNMQSVSLNPRRKHVYAGMWGPIEIGVVALTSFLLFAMVMFYLLMVVPAQRELTAGQRQRDDLDRELRSAREKWGDIRSTETQVAKLLASAEDFENRALKEESVGTTSIYQRINVLINAYGLRNTSGPDYVPLEGGNTTKAGQRESSAKRGRDKFRSLFPGIYITTTVDGSYQNLRRFIRDIESSNEFVAITSIELEPSDEEAAKAETQAVEVADSKGRKTTQRFRKGRYRGSTVSLRIEMAAYFRRPADQRLNSITPDSANGAEEASPASTD